MERISAIAIGWRSPGEQGACAVFLQAPSPRPIRDQVALVFGDRSADLQQQLIVRILAHWSLDELDEAAAFFQFLDQEHLVNILAGQSIWGRHQHTIKVRLRDGEMIILLVSHSNWL